MDHQCSPAFWHVEIASLTREVAGTSADLPALSLSTTTGWVISRAWRSVSLSPLTLPSAGQPNGRCGRAYPYSIGTPSSPSESRAAVVSNSPASKVRPLRTKGNITHPAAVCCLKQRFKGANGAVSRPRVPRRAMWQCQWGGQGVCRGVRRMHDRSKTGLPAPRRTDGGTCPALSACQLVDLAPTRNQAHAAAAGRGRGQEGEPAETRLGLARMNALLLEAFSAYAAILHAGSVNYAAGRRGVGLFGSPAERGIDAVDDQAAE